MLIGDHGLNVLQPGKSETSVLRRTFMRVLLMLTILSISIPIVYGQEPSAKKPSRTELITQVQSSNVEERMNAFEQLRSDPVALRDPQVKSALVSLLDHENHEPVSGDEEDYADYTSWLADTVAKLVDWSDPHQVCILANSSDLPDELADHAKVTIPCLLQRSRSISLQDRDQGNVVSMLVQSLAKGRTSVDAATIQTVDQVIASALNNPNKNVKIPTILALKDFGGKEMIPSLRVVAESDPDPSEGYAIRKWASQAISAIQTRTGQN
jgi:hypothetical protein